MRTIRPDVLRSSPTFLLWKTEGFFLGEKGAGCEVYHQLLFSAELRMNGDVFPLAPQAYLTYKITSIITRNHFDQNIIFWNYPVLKSNILW